MEKVGRLAYKLDISLYWQIYPIFPVAQLKPTPPPVENFFERPFPSNPPSLFVEGNTNKLKSFEIERLLNKCQVKKEKDQAIEYLVHWKRYGPK